MELKKGTFEDKDNAITIEGISIGTDGNIYSSENNNISIKDCSINRNIVGNRRNANSPLMAYQFNTVFDRGVDAEISVGSNPRGIAFDGTHIWVSNWSSNTVFKIDPKTNIIVATVASVSKAWDIAYDTNGFIWVTGESGYAIYKIDINTNLIVDTISLTSGSFVKAIAYDGNGFMWIEVNTSIQKININDNTITSVTGFSDTGDHIVFDGNKMWVSGGTTNKIHSIDISTHDTNDITVTSVTNTRPLSFDGEYIWVGGSNSNNVRKINTVTSSLETLVSVGSSPQGMAFDGQYIYVSNQGSDTVSKIDTNTDTVVDTISVGDVPNKIAFDGRYIWVSNYTDNTVSKIYTI